jgi:protein-tyrosine phosphatase
MSFLASIFKPEYLKQPAAWFHPRILVGPGAYLTQTFQQQHNITAVINCAFQEDSPLWYRFNNPETYDCLYAIDGPNQDILTWYPGFAASLRTFLRNTPGVVYVHCQAGMNRSAALALAYVCKNLGANLDITLQSVLRQRPCMLQNLTFKRQVCEFVNGGIPREESSRRLRLGFNTGNTGFAPSGAGDRTTGDLVSTGQPKTGTGDPTGGGGEALCDE